MNAETCSKYFVCFNAVLIRQGIHWLSNLSSISQSWTQCVMNPVPSDSGIFAFGCCLSHT